MGTKFRKVPVSCRGNEDIATEETILTSSALEKNLHRRASSWSSAEALPPAKVVAADAPGSLSQHTYPRILYLFILCVPPMK
jgi:hypothetical protein